MRNAAPEGPLLEIHNRSKRKRVQTRSTHQSPIDLRLRHQSLDIVRLDAATIKDAQVVRGLLPKLGAGEFPDDAMSLGGDLRRGRLAGPDSPHRLIGNQNLR